MATFHVDGHLKLTISVDEFGTTIVSKQYLDSNAAHCIFSF